VSLTAKDVAEITKLLEESDFDELYLELDGMKLSLRRGGGAEPAAPAERPRATAATGVATTRTPAIAAAATAAEPTGSSTASGAEDARLHSVTAPLLGTFYRAPKPGAPPFVEVGAAVEPDTVIAIIEVMKLMNTVRAGVHGRVVQILALDGALVEYGEALLRVSRTA
jgi:acetyl-CoA carboxylase biotin carboxyl carrier protein